MNADRFELVPLDAIQPSPTNPRKRFDAAKLEELAESIREMGVIQPVVLRPLAAAGTYELVCGERRFRASRLAQRPTLPAIVRELTDSAVLEIQLLENAQREDVDPIEEAEAMKRCLDAGVYGPDRKAAVAAMAAKLGMSERWAYGRLELLKLTDEARKELQAGNITMSHAALLAPYAPEAQHRCLSFLLYEQRWQGMQYVRGKRKPECDYSVRQLSDYIDRTLVRDLDKAPFRITDPDLLPEAGPCVASRSCERACPFRTGAQEGFTGKDRCLNPDCYAKKIEAGKQVRIREAVEANPGAVLICTGYDSKAPGALGYGDFEMAKEGEPGAKPAVVASAYSDADVGQIRWIREKGTPEQRRLAAEAKKAQEEIADRKLRVARTFRRSLLEATAAISGSLGLLGGSLLRTAVERLAADLYESHLDKIGRHFKWEKAGQWGATLRQRAAKSSAAELTEIAVWLMFVKDLEVTPYMAERGDEPTQLIAVAKEVGVDVDHIRREAEEKHAPKTLVQVFAEEAAQTSARNSEVTA